MEIGDIKEVDNVGKMVYIDLGEDNCFVIAPKLASFIDGLRQKIDDIEQYVDECCQLKLDLKHYENMKEEMKMKDSNINRLQEEILSNRKNIMKVIEEIKVEISENPMNANTGKKDCLRRLYKILGE